MVEDRVTDGRRIAELLASEVRGRSDGPLGALSVVDVRDVEPTSDGARAYRIAAGDDRIASVHVHPEGVALAVAGGWEIGATARAAGLAVRPADERGDTVVCVPSGAAVKRARDVLERRAREG